MIKKGFQKVAIIGAGTAGLFLAWKLSRLGHKVTLFEKKDSVGGKVCSGLISERLKSFVPLDRSIIENEIDFCLIHFPRKIIKLRFAPIHFAVNRQKLSEKMLELAKEAGAEVLFNQSPSGFPAGYDKIIGCDGALSKMRESLSLPNPSFRLGLQIFKKQEDRSDFVEVWPIRNGFCWKIPRGGEVEYGALGPFNSAKNNFKEFCQKQKIYFTETELKSALVPSGLIIPKSKKITLCGDAMGLTKPWSGGGVIWGLTAAEILLKHFPDFDKYHREVKNFFLPKIVKGRFATSSAYFLGSNLSFLLPSELSRDNDFPVF